MKKSLKPDHGTWPSGERYAEALIREIDAKLALPMQHGTPSGNQMRRYAVEPDDETYKAHRNFYWMTDVPGKKTAINMLVTEYLATHPDFVYPDSGDRHPAILSIGGQMQPWLRRVLGGQRGYWLAMFSSAQIWFDHEGAENSTEFKVFCYCFEAEGNVSGTGTPEYETLARIYQDWRRSRKLKFPRVR